MDLSEVAAGLYAADPADFVAQRTAAAAAADDRELARSIRALRKPSAAAAVVNALVRTRPEVVDAVLAVGDRMRDAFADRDRDAIRELTRERQRLLHDATASLDASPAVLREVEETLQAAVIDPAAAAAVRSGMLVKALESTGLESADADEAVAVPGVVLLEPGTAPPARRSTAAGRTPNPPADTAGEKEPRETAAERRERQRRVRAAERALARARAEAEALDDELDEETDRRGDLEAERDTLERRLRRTTDELTESRAAERELRSRIADAQRAVRAAEKELRSAEAD